MTEITVRKVAVWLCILLTSACAANAPTHSEDPFADGLPPLADVPFYRADSDRTAIDPGPGPIGDPILAWEHPLEVMATLFPILVDGLLITGTEDGEVIALDGHSGGVHWRATGHGRLSGSASAANGVVVVADAQTVYGLDVASGAEIWHRDLASEDPRPEIVDGTVYLGSVDGTVQGYDLETGGDRWSWRGPRGVSVRVDVVSDGIVYVSASNGLFLAVSLTDHRELWRYHGRSSRVVPELVGDTVYLSAVPTDVNPRLGEVTALDVATGERRWDWSPPQGLQAVAGPFRDGVLYVSTHEDGVFALRDEGSSYSPIWQAEDAPLADWPMAMAGDLLYLQTQQDGIAALRPDDGAILWQTGAPGGFGPIVSGGMVFSVATSAGQSIVEAWVEASIAGLLPSPAITPAASEAPPAAPNPFTVVRTFPRSVTGVQTPSPGSDPEGVSVAVGPDGFLYVADLKPSVTVIDPETGRPVRSWGGPGSHNGEFGDRIFSIAVAPSGLVYVSDPGNYRIQVFKPDGTYVREIGSFGGAEGQFSSLGFIAVGDDGSVFVQDPGLGALTKFDEHGAFLWRIGGKENSDLRSTIHCFAVMNDGNILVTFEVGGEALILDPEDGSTIRHWPGESALGASSEPSFDAVGDVFVFQYGQEAILAFNAKGTLLGGAYFGGATPDPYRLYPAPAFTPDGSAYSFDQRLGLVQLKVRLPPG